MLTFLQEKNSVAAVLGKIDGSTANTIRDNAINESRQFDIANYYPFSWLEMSTTITTSSTGKVDLPDNFNVTHKIKDVRKIGTGIQDDTPLFPINKELTDNYGVGDCKYYINYNTSTDKWQINTTEPSISITIIYYSIPTTLTADIDIDSVPDLLAIKYFAASKYWLTERNYGNYDRFNAMGQKRLDLMVTKDKQSNPERIRRINGADMGWNR